MADFARYYIEFIQQLFINIWQYIQNRWWIPFRVALVDDIRGYIEQLTTAIVDFNALDWVLLILVFMVNIAFITFLVIRIFQLLRRYIRFAKREIEKDDLLEEIASLNQRSVELINEKNQIFALKMESLGLAPTNQDLMQIDTTTKPKEKSSRFVKLTGIDDKYRSQVQDYQMAIDDMVGLAEITTRFVNFAASQLKLYYNRKIIMCYFAGMAASKILILEGISGTGKTSLPYAMGKFFQNDTGIVSVQPSWRDRAEMIGYLNEFTKKFNETDFLAELYETTYRKDLNFIILDEMNLARIEYYFAEFLSIMEMPNVNEWKIDIVPEQLASDPIHLKVGKLLVPQNVWFVGTANKDDSTFTITDKVYDRASTIEINTKADYIDAPFTQSMTMSYDYLTELFHKAISENPLSLKAQDNLEKLDQFITQKFKITFGNRILKQMRLFVPVYVACGGTELDGLDYVVARKILRKFEMLNLPFLQKELAELITMIERLFGKNQFKESIALINEFRKYA